METPILNPGWNTFLAGLPFVFFLVAGFFRLDILLVARHRKRQAHRTLGVGRDGKMVLTDPDGRPWGAHLPSK
jgi:hypothetical protein